MTSTTKFTFTSTQSGTITSGCGVGSATAVGPTQDYLSFSTTTPAELYTFTLPVAGATNWNAATTNSADAIGGTSAIIVDNDSSGGQASSIYFGTLGTSTTLCGSGTNYCAVKVTQAALQ